MEILRRTGTATGMHFDMTFALDLVGDIAKDRKLVLVTINESPRRGAGPPMAGRVTARIEQRGATCPWRSRRRC